MPKTGAWSQGEVEHLFVARFEQHKEFSQIAKELNRSYESIRTKFRDTNWNSYSLAQIPDEVAAPRELANGWGDEEMAILHAGRTAIPLKPYNLIAAEIGRSAEACKGKFNRTDWESLGYDSRPEAESRFVVKSELVNKELNAFDKRYSMMQIKADVLGDVFERSIERLPKAPKSIYIHTNSKTATGTPEDVGLLLSDLHIGHQHTLEDTGGISEYNHDIFNERMENLKRSVVEIHKLHSKLYKLPTLHIFSAGDIVAGMNDAGQWSPLYIAEPIVDQMIHGFDAISEMIYYWLGLFDNIVFYGVGGNHGRTAKANVQKDHDNWDYVCYRFLEVAFRNNPRVQFQIPKTWWVMPKIRNHNFLMIHGDYTKGGMKGIQTFEGKMGSILKMNPDYTLSGHYHNAGELGTNCGKIVLNGSFIGSDVYSLRNVHAASVPEQKLFGIHDRHGITWTYNINLDSQRDKE